MRRYAVIGALSACVVLVGLHTAIVTAAEKIRDVKPAVAELKIFQSWVGEWNEVAEFANGVKVKAKGTNRFILGGQYLQSHFTMDLGGNRKLQNMMMISWDKKKKKYVVWQFSSSGRSQQSSATWNAKKKELVSTSTDEKGTVTKSTTRVVGSNQLKWTVIQIDKSGKVIPLVKGVDTRKK